MSVFSYFRAPFPSAQGFSPYRFPGLMVHLPFLGASVWVGYLLCWPHLTLRPFLAVWFLAGLYLGRDVAIFCHYALPLALVVWVAAFLALSKATSISKFGTSHVMVPAIISLALAAVFIAQIYRSSKQ